MKIIVGIIAFISLYILWEVLKAVIVVIIKTALHLPTESKIEKENEDMDKDTIYANAPNKIKCKCLHCNQVVMIPKQYLNLTYRGPQTSKCPNCDWKMRKVKIIQEKGLG